MGYLEQNFIEEEQEFKVLVVSHGLQAVIRGLLLGQGGIFLLFLKAGDKMTM